MVFGGEFYVKKWCGVLVLFIFGLEFINACCRCLLGRYFQAANDV